MKRIKLLLVGAGFMGKEHLKAAQGLESALYVGVVDANIKAAQNLGSEYKIKCFNDIEQALEQTQANAVDICVPTPYHLPIIKKCTESSVDVLCEKPVTRSIDDAIEIQSISDKNSIRIMVAQVLRFWPEYVHAKEIALSDKYGKILSIDCKRLSSPPAWNTWIVLPQGGGGAVIDLQIHDMDFILQLLGKPKSIQSVGRLYKGAVNTVYTRLIYSKDISVLTEASFLLPESYPFRMYFKIEFEKAILEMDFWRPKGERMKVFPHEGRSFFPVLPKNDAYKEEIDYFCKRIIDGEEFDKVPLDESILALKMCLASEKSCLGNEMVMID